MDTNNFYMLLGLITLILLFALSFYFIIICNKKNKKKNYPSAAERKRIRAEQEAAMDRGKIENIARRIREFTEIDAVEIEVVTSEPISLTASKFGGTPYWPRDKEFPENLVLLAQINLSDIGFENILPKSGLLQFYIEQSDLDGIGRDDLVYYFPEIDETVTEADIKARGIKSNIDLGDREILPFTGMYSLTFKPVKSHVSVGLDRCDKVLEHVLKEDYNEELTGGTSYKYFNDAEFDYFSDLLEGNWRHQMLGYPEFTQNDVTKDDDILLFQMNSEGNIMWGDSGIANYFIKKKALEDLDFSKTYFTWDCY